MEDEYSNIRELLKHLIGAKVVDITQHDPEHFQETGESFVEFLFDNGDTIHFPIGDDGFKYTEEVPG